jgi:CO/xanthine dehydrogenase FAD-binding subunit
MTGQVRAARPGDLADVASLIRGFDGQIAYVAGGTDLIIAQENTPWPDLIVDISRTNGLDFIEIGKDAVRIGAATTLTALAGHAGLGQALPVLCQAAAQVGSVQIRNRATIGGNIASAVPAGDLLPVLSCLQAQIHILRGDGRRDVLKFHDVVTGRGETSLQNGDLITLIDLPLRYGKNRLSAFAKIGPRQVLAIARINMAIQADYDRATNWLGEVRIVAGALGPVPLRLRPVEAVARDRQVDATLADDFLDALCTAVDDAIPGRYSQPYKRRAIAGLGLDLLGGLFGRALDTHRLGERA